MTALMLAASSNNPSIVALLLHKEANIAGKDFEGRTALHLAAAGNSVEAIKVLCFKGYRLYQNFRLLGRMISFHFAVLHH